MPLTANGLDYPVLADGNNPPADIQAALVSVDSRYGLTVATTAALAAIATPFPGMRVWVTAILRHAVYNGSAWTWPTRDRVSNTSGSASTSGTSELTLVTSTAGLVFDGLTPHEVSFNWYSFVQTVGTDTFVLRLYDGSSIIGQARVGSAANSPGGVARVDVTPSAGAHTFSARVIRSGSGTGTATLVAQADAPAQLVVRTSA